MFPRLYLLERKPVQLLAPAACRPQEKVIPAALLLTAFLTERVSVLPFRRLFPRGISLNFSPGSHFFSQKVRFFFTKMSQFGQSSKLLKFLQGAP